MAASSRELANFWWYCASIVVQLELPGNAATWSCSRHALRNATDAYAGKRGVRYASAAARAAMEANGGKWTNCGLAKEHAIPVGHIHQLLIEAMGAHRTEAELEAAKNRLAEELAASGVDPKRLAGFPLNPRTIYIADIIRASTLMAWITDDEHRRLKTASKAGLGNLNQRMPAGWDGQDPFARYRACDIEVLAL